MFVYNLFMGSNKYMFFCSVGCHLYLLHHLKNVHLFLFPRISLLCVLVRRRRGRRRNHNRRKEKEIKGDEEGGKKKLEEKKRKEKLKEEEEGENYICFRIFFFQKKHVCNIPYYLV